MIILNICMTYSGRTTYMIECVNAFVDNKQQFFVDAAHNSSGDAASLGERHWHQPCITNSLPFKINHSLDTLTNGVGVHVARPIVNNPIKNSKDCPQSPNQRRAIIPMRSWRPRNDYTQISQIRCYIIEVQIFALLNPLHTRPSSECGKYNGSRNIVSVSNHTWIIYSSRPMILDYFASNRLLGLDWRHQRALSSAISWLKKKTKSYTDILS